MMYLESVAAYEGTHDIHLLITGQDVSGLAAFKQLFPSRSAAPILPIGTRNCGLVAVSVMAAATR